MNKWVPCDCGYEWTTTIIYHPQDICTAGGLHCIKWVPSKTSAGLPNTMDVICIKCGKVLDTIEPCN